MQSATSATSLERMIYTNDISTFTELIVYFYVNGRIRPIDAIVLLSVKWLVSAFFIQDAAKMLITLAIRQ